MLKLAVYEKCDCVVQDCIISIFTDWGTKKMCYLRFITYITAKMPAPNFLEVDVIGTGIFHQHLVP